MKPNPDFQVLPKSFWGSVRSISQVCGYTNRGKGTVKVPTIEEMSSALSKIDLDPECLETEYAGDSLGNLLSQYFTFRARILNNHAQHALMDADQARKLFEETRARLNPSCPIPLNKQKGAKKAPAYLTALVNMILEENLDGDDVDYDPRQLTTITSSGAPLRTLSRRVDGAYPSTINPQAIWEIKEYYYTTTFGSRVADGVYETLLDGMELEELYDSENIDVKHYLFIDAHYTWWECGKSYLCRMVDMMHMGYVDQIFVGRDVVDELPGVVQSWRTT
jgi:hypothetical protein